MSLSEKVLQLNQQIGGALERALTELRREASEAAERLRTSTDEVVRRLESYTPELPGSFLRDEDLEPSVTEAAQGAVATAGRRTRRAAFGELREALDGIDRARSQAEILNALLQGTSSFASRAAVLLLRGNEARGWGSRGFGDAEAAVRQVAIAVPADGADSAGGNAWGRLAAGQGGARLSGAEAAELSSRAESAAPDRAVVVPLVLRDRVAAAIYADRLDGAELSSEAIQILTYVAALAIESLPFRERASTSTLQLEPDTEDEEESPAAPAADPPATTAETAETEEATSSAVAPVAAVAAVSAMAAPEVAAEPEPAPAPAEPEPRYFETSPAASAPEPEAALPAAEPAAEPVAEPAEQEIPWTVEPEEEIVAAGEPEPVPALAYAAEPEPAPAPAFEATPAFGGDLPDLPSYEEEAPAPVPVTAFPTQTQELPVSRFEAPAAEPSPAPAAQETVMLPRSAFGGVGGGISSGTEPVSAPPPLRPVPVPAPEPVAAPAVGSGSSFDALRTTPLGGGTPLVSGSPEVAPPSDVQGPGWAFATTRVPVSPNEESLHEEARRLARLLVSEIKLYNEEQVEEGRRNRDLYERLKEDIDRSRQMYEERVEPRILKSTDYFYEELVRILAAGDSIALGI